ncbi:hypothetical protein PT974_12463 [Cladobotryum mycophilum]|uniref:ATP-grasp domain-containing protein n=1 Tax=Cladobotryum mycophilum TaxID=491253 RepID=A0ABR0S816_9HYPO
MPVVIFGLDSSSPDPDTIPADHAEVYRTLSQLRHDQQPIVSIVTDLDQLQLAPDTRIAVKMPDDCLLHLPHVVDADVHYELLSKRALARSGLPTPSSTVIDVLLQPEQVHDPVNLEGEVSRMTSYFDVHPLPFVVKLNQSIGGKGAIPVHSEADRTRIKAIVSAHLRGMLPHINAANHHLHPCSLVLQDYVAGPTAMSLSLFVTQKGRAIFVVCSEQEFDEKGHWIAGSVSYADQEAMRQRYARCMEETAQFLHQKGYYGPAGIDIMTDASGAQYIVDINPRMTTSYHLGQLAGHFVRRGLSKATVIKDHFPCSRTIFEETFLPELQDGSLVVTGWARNESLSLSQGTVTVGGCDELEVESLLARVHAHVLPLSAFCKK